MQLGGGGVRYSKNKRFPVILPISIKFTNLRPYSLRDKPSAKITMVILWKLQSTLSKLQI